MPVIWADLKFLRIFFLVHTPQPAQRPSGSAGQHTFISLPFLYKARLHLSYANILLSGLSGRRYLLFLQHKKSQRLRASFQQTEKLNRKLIFGNSFTVQLLQYIRLCCCQVLFFHFRKNSLQCWLGNDSGL